MLKIKDNVDLKELEKFGFSIRPHGFYAKSIKCLVDITGAYYETFIVVNEDKSLSKVLVFSMYRKVVFDEKIKKLRKKDVADLIQAGLVERVG